MNYAVKKNKLINIFIPVLLIIVLTVGLLAVFFLIKDSRGQQMIDEYTDTATGVQVTIDGRSNGITETSVEEVSGFNGRAGIIKMYNFHTEAEVYSAEIKIPYDEETLAAGGEDKLVISRFDPETAVLTDLNTHIDKANRTVTAVTPHFSMYCVRVDDNGNPSLQILTDVFFILDNSVSMYDADQVLEKSTSQVQVDWEYGNDPKYKRVDLSISLIDKLKGAGFTFGAGKFTEDYTLLSPFTDDAEAVKKSINGIKSGQETFNGTYIGNALAEGAASFYGSGDESGREKYIIFLTDGVDSADSEEWKNKLDGAIARCADNGIKLLVVGLGDANTLNTSILMRIADETGGDCFLAAKADTLDDLYK
jgi:hypothetical protein